MAEVIICRLFRGIAKQDIGGCEASTLIVRGITVVSRHRDIGHVLMSNDLLDNEIMETMCRSNQKSA